MWIIPPVIICDGFHINDDLRLRHIRLGTFDKFFDEFGGGA